MFQRPRRQCFGVLGGFSHWAQVFLRWTFHQWREKRKTTAKVGFIKGMDDFGDAVPFSRLCPLNFQRIYLFVVCEIRSERDERIWTLNTMRFVVGHAWLVCVLFLSHHLSSRWCCPDGSKQPTTAILIYLCRLPRLLTRMADDLSLHSHFDWLLPSAYIIYTNNIILVTLV